MKTLQEKSYELNKLEHDIEKRKEELKEFDLIKAEVERLGRDWKEVIPQIILKKELDEWRDEIEKIKNLKYELESYNEQLVNKNLKDTKDNRELCNTISVNKNLLALQNTKINNNIKTIKLQESEIKESEALKNLVLADIKDKKNEKQTLIDSISPIRQEKLDAENAKNSAISEKEKYEQQLKDVKNKTMEQDEFYKSRKIELENKYKELHEKMEKDFQDRKTILEEENRIQVEKNNKEKGDISETIFYVNKTIEQLQEVKEGIEDYRKKKLNIIIPDKL